MLLQTWNGYQPFLLRQFCKKGPDFWDNKNEHFHIHLTLVSSLWICNFSQYLCTAFHKFKHTTVCNENLPAIAKYNNWIHELHMQRRIPSALKNWGVKIVNSNLFSIAVAQIPGYFAWITMTELSLTSVLVKDMVVLTTVFWSVSSLGFFALQGKRGHQFSTCKIITSK